MARYRSRQSRRQRLLRLILLFVLTFLIIRGIYNSFGMNIPAYVEPVSSLPVAPNTKQILLEPIDFNSTTSNNIYFVEPTGRSNFAGRELCAIEAAARQHPQNETYVLLHSMHLWETPGIKSLKESYPNLFFKRFSFEELLQGLPLMNSFKEGKWDESAIDFGSSIPRHFADAMPLALLYKHGGTYLELDVIAKKPLSSLPPNTQGWEADGALHGGVLVNFVPRNQYLHYVLFENTKINLYLVVLKKRHPKLVSSGELHMAPYSFFHPIATGPSYWGFLNPALWLRGYWETPAYYFEPARSADVFQATKKSYTIHLYDAFSNRYKVDKQGKQPIAIFAREACPAAFNSRETF